MGNGLNRNRLLTQIKEGVQAQCGGASSSFWGGTWSGATDKPIKALKVDYSIIGIFQDNPWGACEITINALLLDGTKQQVFYRRNTIGQTWDINGGVDVDIDKTTGIELIVSGKTRVTSSNVYIAMWEE